MGLFGRQNKEKEMRGGVGSATMAKDPVCGMQVNTERAAATSVYAGKTYYFCAAACQKSFEQNPEKYLGGEAGTGHAGHGSHGGHGCCG